MGDGMKYLENFIYGLKKRMKIIILCIVSLTLIATLIANYSMDVSYQARVKIFAGKTENVQSDYSTNDLSTYSDMMNTYIQLIKTEDFMNIIIKKANLDMSAQQLMSGFQFTAVSGTPILQITYTANSPEVAEEVITILTEEFDKQVGEVIINTYTVVIDSVKVSTTIPDKLSVIIMGMMLGVILGVGLALILDYFDDTIARKEDLEKIIPIAVIGEISLDTTEVVHIKKNRLRKGK